MFLNSGGGIGNPLTAGRNVTTLGPTLKGSSA